MLSFAYPAWLFGLLLLPLLALIHWQQVQQRRAALEAFAREPLWAKMDMRPGLDGRFWRGAMLLLALGLGLVALAQPRWGAAGSSMDASQQGSLVVMLDVSKSMMAHDADGDSRLHAGQRLLDDLVPLLTGWKIGVVAFAGEGAALVPLTTDHTAVETLLERAQPGQAPGLGSNMEAGLKTSLDLFTQPGRRVLLVVSDGEELSGNGRTVMPQLRQKGVQVLTVGVGSPQGDVVPGGSDMWGNPTPITYRGQKVVSKLQDASLKALASETGGRYWQLDSPRVVRQVAGMLGAGKVAAQPVAPTDRPKQGYELFQLPLVLALALVLAESLWGLLGRARREERFVDHLKEQLARGGAHKAGTPWWRRLGDRLKRPAVGVLLLAIAFSQTAWTWYPSWLPNWEAGKAYQQGDYDQAGKLVEQAVKADPGNWRLHYNLGNSRYEGGNFASAVADFQRAWDLADPASRPAVGYNLGNAYFRQAEATDDPKGYQQAITEYERVLAERPDDADARHNLEVARRRLKSARQQPQKQGQQGQGGQPQAGGSGSSQTPVGVDHQRKPLPPMKNLPSEAEVEALLKALESDERQRQAEQGAEQSPDPQGGFGQHILQQALGQLDMQKDW